MRDLYHINLPKTPIFLNVNSYLKEYTAKNFTHPKDTHNLTKAVENVILTHTKILFKEMQASGERNA